MYASLRPGITLFAEIHEPYDQRTSTVLKIEKNIYGLRESPSLWFSHLRDALKDLGLLLPLQHEEFIFANSPHSLYIVVYVDDIIVFGDQRNISAFVSKFKKKFEITGGQWRISK